MVSRAESAAATRRALLDAAAVLLDRGGPDAVTLRAVAGMAGVTRGAPYRHFPDKDSLLTTVATEALERIADGVEAVGADPQLPSAERLHNALTALLTIGRRQPHLYRLMFAAPAGDPAVVTAAGRAADRAMDGFLAVVDDVVGSPPARRFAALLLTSVHGIVSLEASGHLAEQKWHATGEELVATLVSMVQQPERSGGRAGGR